MLTEKEKGERKSELMLIADHDLGEVNRRILSTWVAHMRTFHPGKESVR